MLEKTPVTSLALYSQPNRHYHNFAHIGHMLKGLGKYFPEHAADVALRLAITYHDCIYHPGAKDNEFQSASAMLEELWGHYSAGTLLEATRLILVTERHTPREGDTLGAVIADLDLMGLGAWYGTYVENGRKVRAEYGEVPDDQWVAGRRAFLEGMLSRETIFHTELGRELWEATARENMTFELENLEGA